MYSAAPRGLTSGFAADRAEQAVAGLAAFLSLGEPDLLGHRAPGVDP
jgi:hypothetical protein